MAFPGLVVASLGFPLEPRAHHPPAVEPLPFCTAVAARLRRVVILDGTARAVAVVLAGGTASVLIDAAWHLPGVVRLGLVTAVGVGAVAVAAARIVRPLRRPWTTTDLARLAERGTPALGGRLATAVAGIDLGPVEGPRLAELLTADLVRVLVPAPRLGRNLACAGAGVALVGATSVAAPTWMADGAVRWLLPLGAREWTRFTQMQAHVERSVAPVDEGLTLVVARQHPRPGFSAPVVVTWNHDGREERRLLPAPAGTAWTTAFQGSPGWYHLLVTSDDALPVEVTGRLVRRPELDRLRVTVTPPAYTGLPAHTAEALGAGMVAGSTVALSVHFHGEADRPLSTCTMRFAEQALTVTPGEPGWFCTTVSARAGGDLIVDARDADGIGPAVPVRLPVAVVADRAPTATLEGPLPREAVTIRAEVGVRVDAADDLGLATVAVVAQGADGTAPTTVLEEAVEGLSSSRTTTVAVAGLAAEGGTVTLRGRARDRNHLSGPGEGLSEPLVLRVLPEDQVRQDVDRALGEARDRIVQARDQLAKAAAGAPADVAMQGATRARDVLAQVLRRWRENHFEAAAIVPAAEAHALVTDTALPRLATDDRTAAEAALAKAERLLASLLGEGDLTRQITSLVTRQQALLETSRAFVRSALLKPLDAAGRQTQAALATRQKDLAAQVAEAQRRVLAQEGAAWAAAQEVVRRDDPGERLRRAAADLASADRRPEAINGQREAIDSLTRLVDLLKGGDAAKDLAGRIGAVAAAQERLAGAMDRGEDPRRVHDRQEDLARETERLAKEAERPSATAAQRLAAALASQRGAAGRMAAGDGAGAASEAAAAAALLREAQEGLAPSPAARKPSDPTTPDVVAVLRSLATVQAALVTDATLLDQRVGEADLDFAGQRSVMALGRTQQDVRLRLDDEVVKRLADHPIAALGVQRIADAMDDSAHHLTRPALGQEGVRLTRVVLAELQRLVAAATPPPPAARTGNGGGGGGAGGSARSPQAAFPPRGELALLAALQDDVAARTVAMAPGDVAAEQRHLQELTAALGQNLRPETRPWVLVERARRAMASAAWRLARQDRGLTTCLEQEAASAALRQLLAEADPPGGGGGGSGGSSPPPPSTASSSPSHDGGGAAPASAANGGQGEATRQAPVQAEAGGQWMNLPPERREQLREARQQHLTPRQLQVYGRYLELLEEK